MSAELGPFDIPDDYSLSEADLDLGWGSMADPADELVDLMLTQDGESPLVELQDDRSISEPQQDF